MRAPPADPDRSAASVARRARHAALFGALLVGLGSLSGGARAHGPGPVLPLEWVLPPSAGVIARHLEPFEHGLRLDLYLDMPTIADGHVDETFVETIVRSALEDEADRGSPVTGVIPWVATDRGWVPLPALLHPIAPPPSKPYEALVAASPTRAGRKPGSLAGKNVYVSAGHGFTWTPNLGRWALQRGNTHGIVEDLVSAETINHYLVHYLENAGATVFTVRERDLNPDMVIVDDGGVQGRGAYRETGTWSESTAAGFATGLAPYMGDINPFTQGRTRVARATGGAPSASAIYTPHIPKSGLYQVYVSYSAGTNRAPDAHYVVRHAGGESHVRVDQRRHGGTWMPLGQWYFYEGQSEAQGAVVLLNDSELGADVFVAADAVRFGGGMGDAGRGTSAAIPRSLVSSRPRWEENARYHVQYNGAPSRVYAYTTSERNDDVGARSRYAAWQNEIGEDAVYVAWHTNAPNPARGTVTYIYGPNPPDGNYNFTGAAGSDRLGRLLHEEIVHDIRGVFDAQWRDRGLKTAYFGEVSPSHNSEMPAALVEVAFHDTEADAIYLRNPRFRQVVARAYYQGIVKYFAERDGYDPILLPEPPTHVQVRGVAPAVARVSWRAPVVDGQGLGGDAATGYRVYRSADGRAFDDGTEVPTGQTFLDVADLEPGVPTYFRVTATNDGGESHKSPVVAVSTGCDGEVPGLLVYGFYRLQDSQAPVEDLSVFALGQVRRLLQDRMNRFDGIIAHAEFMAAAGIAFDSAEAPAVEAGDLALGPYRVISWVLGEESTVDETFSKTEQTLVSNWLGDGRLLIVSGAELGWDLHARGDAEDQAFFASLGAQYVADDAGTYGLVIPGGGVLALDDGTLGMYDVDTPDVLAPLSGGQTVLAYDGPGARTAGLHFRHPQRGYETLVFGLPIEAVFPSAGREAFMVGLLEGVDAVIPRLPVDGCPEVIGPEPGVEPVPDAGPGDPADTVDPVDGGVDTAEPGGPSPSGPISPEVRRETSTSIRTFDGQGCAGGGSSSAGWLLLLLGLYGLARRAPGRP